MVSFWLHRDAGCGLFVAMVEEETKKNILDSGIFLITVSHFTLLPSYLVLVGEKRGIKFKKRRTLELAKTTYRLPLVIYLLCIVYQSFSISIFKSKVFEMFLIPQ